VPAGALAPTPANSSSLESASLCLNCGAPLIPGKAFCRKCGHAAAVQSPSPQVGDALDSPESLLPEEPNLEGDYQTVVELFQTPEQEVPVELAATLLPTCIKCRMEIVPGKAFCRRCGHRVGAPVHAEPNIDDLPVAEPCALVESLQEAVQQAPAEALPASELPSPDEASVTLAPTCVNCGTELSFGKTFCRKCGHPIGAPVAAETNINALPVADSCVPIDSPQEAVQQAPAEALPASELPSPDEASVRSVPTCANCGTELPIGKAFCRKCGHPIGAPVAAETNVNALPVADSCVPIESHQEAVQQAPAEALPASEQPDSADAGITSALTCANCGTELSIGKTFCRKCGQLVAASTNSDSHKALTSRALVFDPLVLSTVGQEEGSADKTSVSAADWKSLLQTSEEPLPMEQTSIPAVASLHQEEASLWKDSTLPACAFLTGSETPPLGEQVTAELDACAATSSADQQRLTGLPVERNPEIPPLGIPFVASSEGSSSTLPRSRPPFRLIAGIAAAILVVAGSGITWYLLHQAQMKRSQIQVAEVKTPNATPEQAQETKPRAGIPSTQTRLAQSEQRPVSSEPRPVANTQTQGKLPIRSQENERVSSLDSNVKKQHLPLPSTADVNRPTPVFQHSAAPAQPRNGMLQYSGPPVAFGGTVVFSNLPKERLRFSFDRDGWQPMIHRNADGSQTLTLRSIKREIQTRCEVGWEVSE